MSRKLHWVILLGLFIISLSSPGLSWTHYENPYKGNTDDVCEKTVDGKVCKDLGEHAYKGRLIERYPSPQEYFLGDAELFNEHIDDFKKYSNKVIIEADEDDEPKYGVINY